jgi:hypothetical protein
MIDKPRNGIGVDRSGGPVIDPTENVRHEMGAERGRADDLREADRELANERNRHVEFVAKLRASHEREVREQNNERLAALRQVDISTRNEDRKTADDAIRRLAESTESLRQTLSKQVTDTASTLSQQKLESDRATEIRIAALEKTSYVGAGEKAVADPAMAQLVIEIKKLSDGAGERRGGTQYMQTAITIIALIIAAASVLLRIR